MTDEQEVQPGVRIDSRVWEQFRADVQDRRGSVRGHLRTELENAIREYVAASKGGDMNDRLRRIENHLESIDEQVGGLSGDDECKKTKDSGVSSTVKNRLEAIESQIEREAGDATKVHESVINQAIEDNAGSSRPTLERYKEMLEQRHIAHKWPIEDSKTWWLDNEQFVRVLDSNYPNRNNEFANLYGEEWFDDLRVEGEDLVERGFA